MDQFYKTSNLKLDQKRVLLYDAQRICDRWWADVLTGESIYRKKVEIPFADMVDKVDENSHFVVIERDMICGREPYLEVGFSTMTTPDYFLWIIVDIKHAKEFIERWELQ